MIDFAYIFNYLQAFYKLLLLKMNTSSKVTLPPMQPKSQATEVHDSFYELFLYEALDHIVSKHLLKQTPMREII